MTPSGRPVHRMFRLATLLLLAAACAEADPDAIDRADTRDSLIYSDTSPRGHVAELHQIRLPGGAAATRLTVTFDDVRCGEGSLLAAGGDLGLFPWWADDTTLVVFHPEDVTFQDAATSDVAQCRDHQVRMLTEPLACGRVDVVGEYHLAHAGRAYRIPGMLEVERDGASLYRAEHVHRWIPPLRSLLAGVADSLLLLRSSETDCIDRTAWTVTVVEPTGDVAVQPGWTSNWDDGFYVVDNELVYWSEWFCHADNSDRRPGMAYLQVYSRADHAWTRRDVRESDVCGSGPAGLRVDMREPERGPRPAR